MLEPHGAILVEKQGVLKLPAETTSKSLLRLEKFFKPKTVAVIGVSRNPNKPGHVIFKNFLNSKFKGRVFPVNPNTEKIDGVKCYPSVRDIPSDVDLVAIAVPAGIVPQVMQDCVEKKVEAAVIISGGFRETGEMGRKLEGELRAIIRDADIRVLGPNCVGVYDAYTGVDTLFYPQHRLNRPVPGNISFISQSGAYGGALLDWAAAHKIGMSKFISLGNMVDVNEIELLEYLKEDPTTQVILVYMEQTSDGRRLVETAKRIVPNKPIVALKVGRTEAGAKAAVSHTGALAGSDKVYEAAFKRSGIIQANVTEELFDFAFALSLQPPAHGDRIAVITNGGGLGVMTADYITYHGMHVANLNPKTKNILKSRLPVRVSVENPVDLTGDADAKRYKIALDSVLGDPNVDGAIVIILFQLPTIEFDTVDVIAYAAKKYGKPIIACTFGGGFVEHGRKLLKLKNIPCYPVPHRAVRAMEGLVLYGRYLKKS